MAENTGGEKTPIPDVLAERYASPAMLALWDPAGRVRLERQFWITVLRVQKELGLDVSDETIAAYERVADRVDLESIRRRELRLRHDLKARIEEFCALAGAEEIHKGLTSRDVTENVEQLQVLRSLRLLRTKSLAALHRLAEKAKETREIVVVGRTHNVPAQPTTLGKRLAMFGEEMLEAFRRFEALLREYPFRGIKGAVGTRADLVELLGSVEKAAELERRVAVRLGFPRLLSAVGQVYPRSLDFEVVSCLYGLVSGPSSFAETFRLMSGLGLVSEGSREGQVGSSAMPHKVNPRNCERIRALRVVLGGFLSMLGELAGTQWNEGDVSCSAVRRVALPGAMFACDGLLDTFLTVLREFEVHPDRAESEIEETLPWIASGAFLAVAVQRGAGREEAHRAIREHLLEHPREADLEGLVAALSGDRRLRLSAEDVRSVLGRVRGYVGAAREQVDDFVRRAEALVDTAPEARDYEPPEIL
ncbi:MAG: adenylosuccinate lyase [Candidatus Binatia bacterium]|nr:MAG: adenylosuccinate lyase [Candidatus Binatia bacterium]